MITKFEFEVITSQRISVEIDDVDPEPGEDPAEVAQQLAKNASQGDFVLAVTGAGERTITAINRKSV